ncbi:putative anion transporter 3, chloroplastic [Halotydeus destructor]|nr:putative anion transporter 3, chloroplastic [Halotydeus destructor]
MRAKTTRIVALCSVANFINSADRIILPIAIIPMKNHHNWTLHWQGWILSSFAFGYITSQIIGASAATKYGGKRVLTFSVLLWSMATLLTPAVASNAYMLIIFRILLGLGEGLGEVTSLNSMVH